MRRNILHVVNVFFVIPYFLGEQLAYFSKKRYKVHLICSPSKEFAEFGQKNKFFYKEIKIVRKISLVRDLCSLLQIMRYIKKNHIEVVSGHTPKGALLAMTAAYLTGVPVRLYFRHGLFYETSVGPKRWILMLMDKVMAFFATRVICVSSYVYQQSIADKLNGEKKQLVLLKGTCNGINTSRFFRKRVSENKVFELKRNYQMDESAFVIDYTGRLVKDKGIAELVNSFRSLLKYHANIYLLLVGMFEEKDTLPEETLLFIRECPRIVCTGYVNYSDIEPYYGMMDLFVLPSYREGLPTSVLEASAMQLPVLTTRVTGCMDSIVENETGIFIDPTDSKSMVWSMKRLIENPYYREQLSQNGRRFVMENFDQYMIWKEIERLYV